MRVFDISFQISQKKHIKFKLKLDTFFTINSSYLSQCGHIIHKVGLADDLRSTWNISLNKIAPYAACMEK